MKSDNNYMKIIVKVRPTDTKEKVVLVSPNMTTLTLKDPYPKEFDLRKKPI